MRKHVRKPSRRDTFVTLAEISSLGVVRGRCVGAHQSRLAGCKPPPLFKRGASSCTSERLLQREQWGASPRPSAPTYLPTYLACLVDPLWCAAPRPVRSLPVRLSVVPPPRYLPVPEALRLRVYWAAAWGTWRPAKNLAHGAFCWPPTSQGR